MCGANGLRLAAWAVFTAALALLGCSSGKTHRASELETVQPDGGAAEAGRGVLPSFPNTGINASTLTVTGIQPRSGPFAGGNEAVVRGSGFTADALVFIGGNMVQPAQTLFVDRNSLRVTVPAGRVGTADVRVEVGDDVAVAVDAYLYVPLQLDPTHGSIAGGTSLLITAHEAVFDEDVQVEVGRGACTELRVITPHQVRCKTPVGMVGLADVRAYFPDDDARGELSAPNAFRYLDPKDTDQGGLSGAAIRGTLNVTVINAAAGFGVAGAFVLVGDDPAGAYQGYTDRRGQITFSGEDLEGPVSVHVSATCMERVSIVAFDAENATIHLSPLLDPSCGEPGDLPTGRGTAGSFISGELIFPGSDEFGVNAWDIVPKPRENEARVTYVFTTRASVSSREPNPGVPGTNQRISEETSPTGVRGYPYSIFARPAGLAVYALSGLERRDTGHFIPYVMGVARDVLTAPGAETTGIDIYMNIPLDRELQIALADLPQGTPRGPTQFRVQAHVDLGGEGVIVRQVNGAALDVRTSFSDASLFRFFAQPALIGTLSDARYRVIAGWYSSGASDVPPYTETRRVGVRQTPDPYRIDDLLAIPVALSPLPGARLPSDRKLRWRMDGEPPDFYSIEIIGGDGISVWSQVVPGTQSEAPIPDLSLATDQGDIAAGTIAWTVRAIRVPDFEYNQFRYNLLSPRYWTHTAVDTFVTQR